MKAQGKNMLNHRSMIALVLFSFMSFGLFAKPPHWAPAFGYHKKHHYVYYPKQNFYYDPFLGTYIVYEEGVWVRQVAPPRIFASININILPHVDLYIASYRPYYYNDNHCRTYRLVTFLAPRNEFYIHRHPMRYDFTITPYYYYHPRHPHGHVHYAHYNPNYYYHPGHPKHYKHGKGKGRGYDMHDNYWAMKGKPHGGGHHKGYPDYKHGEKHGGKKGNHAPAPWGNPKSNGNGNGNKQKGDNQFPLNTPSNHGKQTDHSKIKHDLQKQQQPQQKSKPQKGHTQQSQPQKGHSDNKPVMFARDNNVGGGNPNGGGKPNGGNMKSNFPQQHGNGGGGKHGGGGSPVGGKQGGGKQGKK